MSELPPELFNLELIRAEKRRRAAATAAAAAEFPSFDDWLPATSPQLRWDYPHLVHIREKLDRVTRGELGRLAIFLPPQHGKSELVTVRYPAYRLEANPALRCLVGSYSAAHANKFSRSTRRLCRQRFNLSRERQAVTEWETEAGGSYRSVGVGSGVTGNPADLIVIDDPIKSRHEAESQAYRDRVWEWFTQDVYSRKSARHAIILIFTRWHVDDLWGRIQNLPSLARDRWEVVSLPAIAEADDPLGRPEGEALCPNLHPIDELLDNKATMGPSFFDSLFQCNPRRREGELIKRSWLKIVPSSGVPRQGMRWVRYWDKAGTADDGAYSAGVLVGRSADGRYWILDVARGQWSIHVRNETIKSVATSDKRQNGWVTTWTEQEPGSGGKESAQITVRDLAGHSVRVDPVRHDKLTRILPFADQAEAGNVCVVQAEWTEDLIDELTAFPRGKYRDQVDAVSGAFNKLASESRDGPGSIGLPPAGQAGNVLDELGGAFD